MKQDFSNQYLESYDYKFITERNEVNIQPDISGNVVKQTAKNVTVVISDDSHSERFTSDVDPEKVHVLQTTDSKSQKTKVQFYVSDTDIGEVLIDIMHSGGGASKSLYGKRLSDLRNIQVEPDGEVIKINKADGTKISGKFYVFDEKLEFKIKEPIANQTLKLVYIPRASRTV